MKEKRPWYMYDPTKLEWKMKIDLDSEERKVREPDNPDLVRRLKRKPFRWYMEPVILDITLDVDYDKYMYVVKGLYVCRFRRDKMVYTKSSDKVVMKEIRKKNRRNMEKILKLPEEWYNNDHVYAIRKKRINGNIIENIGEIVDYGPRGGVRVENKEYYFKKNKQRMSKSVLKARIRENKKELEKEIKHSEMLLDGIYDDEKESWILPKRWKEMGFKPVTRDGIPIKCWMCPSDGRMVSIHIVERSKYNYLFRVVNINKRSILEVKTVYLKSALSRAFKYMHDIYKINKRIRKLKKKVNLL
jgi:hypothetical protein